MDIQRGSIWRKWDLHVHSPYTFLANKYNDTTLDIFVQKIIDSGLSVIGLTNYFRFHDNEYEIFNKLRSAGITVFPNIEFRTQPQNNEGDELHIHVIFSESTSVQIITNFLGRLSTISGKYCKDLTQEDVMRVSIPFDSLKTKLHEDKDLVYLKDYILVACPRGLGNFRPSRDDDGRGNELAIEIDKCTDLLFGNVNDISHFLNKNRYEKAQEKSVFWCSDAHSLDEIATKFTWVKADPSFEGLKQCIYEPIDRVKIQTRNPSESKSPRIVIDHITFNDSTGKQQQISFNKDLVSIIGSRGSGKSTLIKNIAKKINDDLFTKRDGKLLELDNFMVYWGDDEINQGSDKSPKNINYLSQGFLSSLTYEDGNRKADRDKFLTDLLIQDPQFSNALQKYKSFSLNNKIKIDELIEILVSTRNSIIDHSESLKLLGAKEEIELEIQAKEKDIEKYKGMDSVLTTDEINRYSNLTNELQNIHNTKITLTQDQSILNTLLATGSNIQISNQEFSRLSLMRQSQLKEELVKQGNEKLVQLIRKEIESINIQLTTLENEDTQKRNELELLRPKIEQNKTIQDLTKEISELQTILQKIIDLNSKILSERNTHTSALNEMLDTFEAYHAQQKLIFDTVQINKNFKFIKIKMKYRYKIEELTSYVEKFINQNKISQILRYDSEISNLLSPTPNPLTRSLAEKLINGFLGEQIITKSEVGSIQEAISNLLRDRHELSYLDSVSMKEGGIPFKNMSGGQKSIALLEIIFKFDDYKYPILIDQPEDDLDIKGVANDVVDFINTEKHERQIIIVSHNASLVVCADSEQIIFSKCRHNAETHGYDFRYVGGGLENPQIRNCVIDVLEGGKEALKKRARKLNFKHEL